MEKSNLPHRSRPSPVATVLQWVERVGNRLPDPAALFVLALFAVWIASWMLAGHEFIVPAKDGPQTLTVQNQLSGKALAAFLANAVHAFTGFAPLGVVLVADGIGWFAGYPLLPVGD